MNKEQSTQLLEEHGIKVTANRIVVLKELVKALHPVTLSELEYKILSIDKSNIFRALTLFKEHHLVHVIEGGSEGCVMSSATVTTMSMMKIFTRISIVRNVSEPSVSTMPKCRRSNCPKATKRDLPT